MQIHRVRVRVRYADVDAMGLAYNAVYLVWFEVGRTEWLRARGMPYREVESRGFSLPVTEAVLRFRAAARYDDEVEIETTIGEFRSRRIAFSYRILRDKICLAEGTTVHSPVEIATGRTVRLPDWLRAVIGGGSAPQGGQG